jgi:hypothetical protein
MKSPVTSSLVTWLAAFASTLLAAHAFAQVPQDMTYTGRLVDNAGQPLAGPVHLELRIFDADSGGTQLYSEEHLGVALDATGGFAVQLGLGTSPSGTFGAALFSDVNRYLEVLVDGQALAPRQMIGSVPWALIAQQANEIVPDPNAPRFEDCGDGTVADHQTGLQWEKKTGTYGTIIECETVGCPDPHIVNNRYRWSQTGTAPDGAAFTDFLAKLNDPTFGEAANSNVVTGCFAGHCDWRLPAIVELKTILDCGAGYPCIDPIFGPANTAWSASQTTGLALNAWVVTFANGGVTFYGKYVSLPARAVRAGSCR